MGRFAAGLLCSACLLLGAARVTAETPPAAAEIPAMTLVTLGTGGGPSYREKRAMSSNAVLVGKEIHIVDAGEGLLHQLAAATLSVENVKSVFITHHHFDHNADLGALITFRWLARGHSPLPVIGPPMTRQMVEDQTRAHRPVELAPITIGGPASPPILSTVAAQDLSAELYSPTVIWQQGTLKVIAVLNDHYHFEEGSEAARLSRSYALRFETPSRTIVFTGDTGPSRRVEALAKGADLLVSEVIDLDRIARQWRENSDADTAYVESLIAHLAEDHLAPEEVGKLAARAGVKAVVLTHLVPGWDDETDPEVYARGVRNHFRGPVHVANDLDRF